MEPAVLVTLAALVLGTTALGLVIRARSGRAIISTSIDDHPDARLAVPGAELTLLLLTSPVCSACAVMRRVSEHVVADDSALARREFDVTERPDLAREHNVLSTPTTLLVDAAGAVHGRIVGAAKPAQVRAAVRAVRESRAAA